MANVIVQDLDNVIIDGANAGQIMDVVRNHPKVLSDVQRALVGWRKDHEAGTAKTIADAHEAAAKTVKDAQEQHAAAVEKIKDEHAKAIEDATKKLDAVNAKHEAEIKKIQADHSEQLQVVKAENEAAIEKIVNQHMLTVIDMDAEHNKAINTIKDEHASDLKKCEAERTALTAQIADLTSQRDALGTKEEAQKIARELKRKELLEQRAAIDAELKQHEPQDEEIR